MDTPTTIRSALATRIATYIEEHGILPIARQVGLFFLAGLLSAAVVNVEVAQEKLVAAFTWKEYAVTKVIWTFALVLNARRIAWLLLHAFDIVADWFTPAEETSAGETIEGIPTVELLDHLFRTKALKVKDATARFGVPQHRVEALVKALRHVQVLVPGPCNASVLNPDFSRQDVASILDGASEAKDLQPLFRRDDCGFTSRPSAAEIRERVQSPTPPLRRAPGFASKELALAS